MTINNVLQAALYALATVTSVAALGVALFGSASYLERWLDGTELGATPRNLDRRDPPAQIASDPR